MACCDRSRAHLSLLPSLDEVLLRLRDACQERSREKLLQAVVQAVPQYQPSELIRGSIEQTA